MKLSRREFGIAAAGSAALAAGGCARLTPLAQAPMGAPQRRDPRTALLRRLTVEPTQADADALDSFGREDFVESLLAAERPEPIALSLRLRRSDALLLDSATLMDLPEARVREGLQSATVLRACFGANPLKERMAIFWGEHFNVFARKGDGTFYRGEEEAAIRGDGLGSFPALLLKVLESPAMLGYLDAPANRAGRPNENLGRELLELHTMGVGGGYSQADVQSAARALTGWTIENRFLRPRGRFRFDPVVHDVGPKTFLGERVPAPSADERGVEEARWIARRAALHPATARRLARRLSLFFAGTPLPRVEGEMAREYLASRGEIVPLLRPLLLSPELDSAPPFLRRPFELLVASIRGTGAETDAGPPLLGHLRRMGQPLYEWPMPDGYPLSERAWGSSFAPRWAFAHDLAHGAIGGTTLPAGSDPAAIAATLAGPEFQWT